MGSAETLWPDRLWLAFARTELPEADLTVLDLGRHPLGDDAQRGAAYAAAVHRLRNFPMPSAPTGSRPCWRRWGPT